MQNDWRGTIRLKSRKLGLLLASIGVIGFSITKAATNTLCFEIDLQKFDNSGEISGVWIQPKELSALKVTQALWIGMILLGLSNTIGLAYLPKLELHISSRQRNKNDEDEIDKEDESEVTKIDSPNLPPALPSIPESALARPNPEPKTIVSRHQEERSELVFKDLLNEPILIIYGPQMGCGKTSTSAGFLARHIKNGAEVTACLPIVAKENFRGIPVATISGTENSYEQIGTAIANFIEIAKERNRRYTQESDYNPHAEPTEVIYLDELLDYESKAGIGTDLLTEFWDVAIRYGRQFNLRAILSTHGVTKVFLGGEKALSSIYRTVIESAAILELERVHDPEVRGGYRPSGKYKLKPSGASVSDVRSGRVKRISGVIPKSFSAPYTNKCYSDGTNERHYDFTQLVKERDLARAKALGFVAPDN